MGAEAHRLLRDSAAQLLRKAGASMAANAAGADVFFVSDPASVPAWVTYHAALGGGLIRDIRGECLAYERGLSIRRWYYVSDQFAVAEPQVADAIIIRATAPDSAWLCVDDRDRFLAMAWKRRRQCVDVANYVFILSWHASTSSGLERRCHHHQQQQKK